MRHDGEAWIDPDPDNPCRFRLKWQVLGQEREVCEGVIYHQKGNHDPVDLTQTWAAQNRTPNTCKFNLFVDISEGYEFYQKSGRAWHLKPPQTTPGRNQKDIKGLHNFKFKDTKSPGEGIVIDILGRGQENFDLHTKPQVKSHPDTTTNRDLAQPRKLKLSTKPWEKYALHSDRGPALAPYEHKYWPLIQLWELHASPYAFFRPKVGLDFSRRICTRNIAWLCSFAFDYHCLQEADNEFAAAGYATISKAINFTKNSLIDDEDGALSWEELELVDAFLPLSRLIWQGGVDFNDQIQRENIVNWQYPMSPYGFVDDLIEENEITSGPTAHRWDFVHHFLQQSVESELDESALAKLVDDYQQECRNLIAAQNHWQTIVRTFQEDDGERYLVWTRELDQDQEEPWMNENPYSFGDDAFVIDPLECLIADCMRNRQAYYDDDADPSPVVLD